MGITLGKAPESGKDEPSVEEALDVLQKAGMLAGCDNVAIGPDALKGISSNPERATRLIRAIEEVAKTQANPPGVGWFLQEVLKAYVILSEEDRKARRYVTVCQSVGLDGKLHPESPVIDTQPEPPTREPMSYRDDGRPQPRVDNRLPVLESKLRTEIEINKKLRETGGLALFAMNKRWAMWTRLVALGSILYVLLLSTAGLIFDGAGGAWIGVILGSITAAILVPTIIIEALHDRAHKQCGGTIGY